MDKYHSKSFIVMLAIIYGLSAKNTFEVPQQTMKDTVEIKLGT